MNVTSATLSSSLLSQLRGGSGGGSSMSALPALVAELVATVSWKQLLVPGLLGYMLLCRALRYRREAAMRRRFGYREGDRAALARMSAGEAQQIIRVIAGYEMPEFHLTSLQFGLFKTYGVESIARLLLGTRNLTDPVASRKRYEDTALLVGEFLMNPPDSERAMRSIARMNFLHSKYVEGGQISNADLLYTLSVFVLEPPRFAKLYEWRELNDMERCAYGVFWKAMGDAMGIEYAGFLPRAGKWRDGLEFFEDIAAWAKMYEASTMKPSQIAAKPAAALIPMLTYWVPWFMEPFVVECVGVLMGDRVRDAFLLPEPGINAAALVYTTLSLRRLFIRYLCLPRLVEVQHFASGGPDPATGRYFLRAPFGNYPFYVKPTVWNRWLSPLTWAVRLAGGKVPGDDPKEFMPQGYSFEDLGPLNRAGLGKEEMERDVRRMEKSGRGGCPFG